MVCDNVDIYIYQRNFISVTWCQINIQFSECNSIFWLKNLRIWNQFAHSRNSYFTIIRCVIVQKNTMSEFIEFECLSSSSKPSDSREKDENPANRREEDEEVIFFVFRFSFF